MKNVTVRRIQKFFVFSVVTSVISCGTALPEKNVFKENETHHTWDAATRPPTNPGGDVVSDSLEVEVEVSKGKAKLDSRQLKSFYLNSKAKGRISFETFQAEVGKQANDVVKSSAASKARIIIIVIFRGDRIIIIVRR